MRSHQVELLAAGGAVLRVIVIMCAGDGDAVDTAAEVVHDAVALVRQADRLVARLPAR